MSPQATAHLVNYVVTLLVSEGFKAVHTTQVIPPKDVSVASYGWTQFPKLSAQQEAFIATVGVTYDQPSGWFRRV